MKSRWLLGLATLLFSISSHASLTTFKTFTGKVGLSTDGFGSITETGTISASVPSGATVLAAYLYTATNITNAIPTVTLGGNAVTFGPRVPNATACCNLASSRADVTSIVKPIIDGGAGGTYNFGLTESGASMSDIDGEALIVVYEDASLSGNTTVGLLDGFASVGGDSATISYVDPLDTTDPDFFAEMRLGIGFSCCQDVPQSGQSSRVTVNGTVITGNAGSNDDNADAFGANGNLLTMGGFDDPFTPGTSTYLNDTERYNLVPYIANGSTSINVVTSNASNDDNIFVAAFYTSGIGRVSTPGDPTATPEPAMLGLMLIGLGGLHMARRRRQTA